MALVAFLCRLLVGNLCRVKGVVETVFSLHRRPLSDESNSNNGIEDVGMVVMGSRQWVEVFSCQSCHGLHGFEWDPMGDAHSCSTGNNFLFYIRVS